MIMGYLSERTQMTWHVLVDERYIKGCPPIPVLALLSLSRTCNFSQHYHEPNAEHHRATQPPRSLVGRERRPVATWIEGVEAVQAQIEGSLMTILRRLGMMCALRLVTCGTHQHHKCEKWHPLKSSPRLSWTITPRGSSASTHHGEKAISTDAPLCARISVNLLAADSYQPARLRRQPRGGPLRIPDGPVPPGRPDIA